MSFYMKRVKIYTFLSFNWIFTGRNAEQAQPVKTKEVTGKQNVKNGYQVEQHWESRDNKKCW